MRNKNPQPLIIKKYENRRLYNTLTSQYINQEQVAQLVREGYDVRVIDAASSEDITRQILAQIVLEDAKTPNSVFPLDVLRQMIVASGKATQENALRYMKAMMEMSQTAYRAMPSPLNPFDLVPTLFAHPQDRPVSPQSPGKATGNREEHTTPNGVSREQRSEVTELRRRIEELEASLLVHKGKRKKTRSRRKS